ncbi:MAG: protein phosphatase 2C domain-containing protein [Clostridiales bacterium]|nr:protein phosphatase 2C domain-containing protein [Clostridiales bacterium]
MITYQIISKTGGRPVNEDCTGMHQVGEGYGFFLADGLGGHGKGDIASRTAVEQAILQFEAGNCSEETLKNIFEAGEAAILERQEAERASQSMKTTLTALLLDENQIRWGHVGDSRIYYFQNHSLVGRTMDHSVPQMLAAAGEIREKDIRHHPDRNRLLRVMGVEWERPAYQLAEPVSRRGSQSFLLCSDGFWELVNEKEMTAALKRASDVGQWLEKMTALVEKHGAGTNMDNYSAVAVWVRD